MRILKVIIIVFFASVLVSCQSNGTLKKSDIGTYSGAIIGGLIGSKFGDGVGRAIAIALGAAAGAYLGHQFGGWLDERDQQDAATVGGEALNSKSDGETVSYTNPETGLVVTATPKNTKTVSREVHVLRLKAVENSKLDIIGEVYIATKSSNLRAGPAIGTYVVGGLKSGESFDAIGRVVDAQYKGHGWIAVGKAGGRLVGYVWEPLVVAKSGDTHSQSVLATSAAIEEIKKEKLSEPVDLDALDIRLSDQSGGYDLDELFEKESIAASTQCRDMNMSVEKGEKNGNSTFTACKTPSGAWEII